MYKVNYIHYVPYQVFSTYPTESKDTDTRDQEFTNDGTRR